ncbi:MAG: hypothetical protein NZ578_09660 [Candidatus Binatia bacterium]|nr:hypothetical protein [Candidatus Binatia bacterium]
MTVMVVAELVVDIVTHALALVADGWQMATHTGHLQPLLSGSRRRVPTAAA